MIPALSVNRGVLKKNLIYIFSFYIFFAVNVSTAETNIERLIKRIVRPGDANDLKVHKIEKWVMKTIRYQSDKKQFNMNDRWTLPWETLQRKKGDCEDGAILLIALAVTAGVPEDRLRLYAPIAMSRGWHAAVAYQRESDNEWVWIEWTVKESRSLGPIEERPTLMNSYAFLPLGNYLEVTSLNPFNMVWLIDDEWRQRAKKILDENRK